MTEPPRVNHGVETITTDQSSIHCLYSPYIYTLVAFLSAFHHHQLQDDKFEEIRENRYFEYNEPAFK
jgi:hypothetical protein